MRDFFGRRERFLAGMPDLKSLLVLTAPYSRENPDPAGKPLGRIARYAVGKDYHRVLRKKLKRLSDALRQTAGPSARTWITVDTSPVPERALAEAAGLGFIGKNSCLIQPRGGSYLFLAVLFTNLDLPPDRPLAWDCGACTLCLKACPTGALVQPYQLDAGRCISTLTIEWKGPLPEPLKPLVQDWLFGCDICQEVCPYNRQTGAGIPFREFQPESGAGAHLDPQDVLSISTEEDFTRRFAGTPLMRAKREGLTRNAVAVAKNIEHAAL